MSTTFATPQPASSWMSVDAIRTGLVAMVFISSFLSRFEPSPCDLFFAAALLFSLGSGLRLSIAIMPMLLLLLVYNFSGVVSYMMIPYDALEGEVYMIGLAYTSASGVFFAAFIAEDPAARFRLIIRSYWIGATIGAVIGLASYFKLEPVYSIFPDHGGRAVGGYKDPNVFSTWLVLPVVTMLQGFILGTLRIRLLSIISFLLVFAALFLAFSRGAWINTIVATTIMVTFTYLLSPSPALRGRIVLSGIAGLIFIGIVLAVLLSIPATQELFLDRFTLIKPYDAGETGRFGNQLNSVPMLIDQPFGFGPYQFGAIFGLAPHNTFLNSFASAGWVGGVSFIVFIVSTLYVGAKTLFIRSPFQPYAIAAFGGFVAVTLQGVQIDMEHWRHFYWMTGMVWGFFAASFRYLHSAASAEEIATAWNLPHPKRS